MYKINGSLLVSPVQHKLLEGLLLFLVMAIVATIFLHYCIRAITNFIFAKFIVYGLRSINILGTTYNLLFT